MPDPNKDHLDTEQDASGFVTQEDGDQDGSSFIQQDQSSFVEAEGPDGGDGSAFISGDGDGSSFINQENAGSSFVSQNTASDPVSGRDISSPIGEDLTESDSSTVHNLSRGSKITLNNQTFTIAEVISQHSREAVIYKVRDDIQQPYALKLYRDHGNKKLEPNAEALARIKNLDDPDIVKLYDFGIGDSKYQGKYCYEISAFAQGGNLLDIGNFKAKYAPEFIEQTVVREIFKGIQALHQQKIIHCDLKPKNIFYLLEDKTDLVIGDYGSAKTFEAGSNKKARQFRTVIATHSYMAPEQAKGIISEKVDYFAFGMILLHLLYPEKFAQDNDFTKVDFQKNARITEKLYGQEAVIEYNPRYRRLNQLIGGLTLYNHHARWGAAEVQRWMRGEQVTVRYKGESLIKPVKLGYVTISSPEDLVHAIGNFKDRWYGDLIEDQAGFNALMDWITSRYDLQVKKDFEQMIRYYQADGRAYVREAIFRFFSPGRSIFMEKKSYQLYENPDVRKVISQFFRDLDSIWKTAPVSYMRFYIFQFEFALRQAEPVAGEHAEYIRKVLKRMSENLRLQHQEEFTASKTYLHRQISLKPADEPKALRILFLFLFVLNVKRPFKDLKNNPITTLGEVGMFFVNNESLYQNKYLKLETEFFLHFKDRKDLIRLPYQEFLFGVFNKETKIRVNLEKVKVDKDRNFTAFYTYQKSLNDFFKSKKIPRSLEEESKQVLSHTIRKKPFQTSWGIFPKFLEAIRKKHKLSEDVLTPANVRKMRNKFVSSGILRNLGHHLSEILTSVILLIPILAGVSLFAITNDSGDSLVRQLFENSGMRDYVENSEQHFGEIQGFYLLLILFAAMYLLSLIPKLWAGKNLELIGKSPSRTSRFLKIDGFLGIKFLAFMTLMPIIFATMNWMWELVGIGLLLFVVGFLRNSESRSGKISARSKRTVIAGLMVLLGLVRLGFEIWSWNEPGNSWETTIPFRGLLDVGFYVLALVIFFIPPVYYQLVKSHNAIQLGIKSLVIAILGVVLLTQPGLATQAISFDGFSFFSTPKEVVDPILPSVYSAQIKDGFSMINLRAGKGTNTEVLKQIPSKEEIMVTKDDLPGWWEVRTCDGVSGYMYHNKIALLYPVKQSEWEAFRSGEKGCE